MVQIRQLRERHQAAFSLYSNGSSPSFSDLEVEAIPRSFSKKHKAQSSSTIQSKQQSSSKRGGQGWQALKQRIQSLQEKDNHDEAFQFAVQLSQQLQEWERHEKSSLVSSLVDHDKENNQAVNANVFISEANPQPKKGIATTNTNGRVCQPTSLSNAKNIVKTNNAVTSVDNGDDDAKPATTMPNQGMQDKSVDLSHNNMTFQSLELPHNITPETADMSDDESFSFASEESQDEDDKESNNDADGMEVIGESCTATVHPSEETAVAKECHEDEVKSESPSVADLFQEPINDFEILRHWFNLAKDQDNGSHSLNGANVDWDSFEKALDQYPRLAQVTDDGTPILFYCLCAYDPQVPLRVVEKLIALNPSCINSRIHAQGGKRTKGMTVLHLHLAAASVRPNFDVCQLLLESNPKLLYYRETVSEGSNKQGTSGQEALLARFGEEASKYLENLGHCLDLDELQHQVESEEAQKLEQCGRV